MQKRLKRVVGWLEDPPYFRKIRLFEAFFVDLVIEVLHAGVFICIEQILHCRFLSSTSRLKSSQVPFF